MTEAEPSSLSDQQLYDRYVALEIKSGEAYHHSRLYKRIHREIMKLTAEINSRQPRIAAVFRAGLSHENPWVRGGVAKFCIDEWRDETLAALKSVMDLNDHAVSVNAGIAYDHYTKGSMIGEETKEQTRKILARTPLPRRE